MRITAHSALPLVLAMTLLGHAAPPDQHEPDWRARFDYWTRREQQRFTPTPARTRLTLTRREGNPVEGLLLETTGEGVTLQTDTGPLFVARSNLSREDRTRLFRDDFARARAFERTLEDQRAIADAPLLPPAELQTQARRLTSVQFQAYAEQINNRLVAWTGRLQDVRLDFFGRYQAALLLTTPPDDNGHAIEVSFAVPSDQAGTLERDAAVHVLGRIESVRLREHVIHITLRDTSFQ